MHSSKQPAEAEAPERAAEPEAAGQGLEVRVKELEARTKALDKDLRRVLDSRTWRALGVYRRARARATRARHQAKALSRKVAFQTRAGRPSSPREDGAASGTVARGPFPGERPPGPDLLVMKRDWDARARENARYYVASSRSDWDEQSFSHSGSLNAEELVFSELDLITGGDDPRSLRLLEIGCGVGRMTEHLAERFGEVHGVDVSGEMVATAKQRLSRFDNVNVHETNGVDLAPFPDSFFDFAFSFIVFQHIPFREVIEGYLREVHRVLKPGRVFKFQVQGTSGEKFAALEKNTWLGVGFSAAEMDALAAEIGFEILRSEGEGTQYFWHWWRAGEAQGENPHADARPDEDPGPADVLPQTAAPAEARLETPPSRSRVTVEGGRFLIRTELAPDVLLGRLRAVEPWRHEIHFSNGVKTTDVATAEPFTGLPSKWGLFEPYVPAESIRGGRALDIGFNAGHHSLLLRTEYDMEVTGIDFDERQFRAAEVLREAAGLDGITFRTEDATLHRRPDHYDLVLHLGTLYHLKHPFVSLENTAASLRPGGFLALETLTLDADDPDLCQFFPRGYAGDNSNWWALGVGAVRGMLETCGLSGVAVVREWANEALAATGMSRTAFVARRPPLPSQ